MTLSKDQILEANDLKTEQVDVPEWGGSVNVRMMSGADRTTFRNSMVDVQPDGTRTPKPDADIETTLVLVTVVDDAGNRIFDDDDGDRLRLKSAAAITRVANVAMRINGIGDQAEAAAEKNSAASLSEGSSSA